MSFVAVFSPEAEGGAWLAMREAAVAGGWRVTSLGPTGWVAVRRGAVDSRPFAGGTIVVVGDLTADVADPWRKSRTPVEAAAITVQKGWGRYVLIFMDAGGALTGVLRDPSGALDCATRNVGSGWIVAGETPDWLIHATQDRPGVSWRAIGQALSDPITLSTVDLLDGWRSVAPGGLVQVDGEDRMMWTPAAAARSGPAILEPACLRRTIDTTVRGLVRDRRRLVVEVSGGLDSAIMAASLKAGGAGGDVIWLNTWGPFRESDERAYARAVVDHLGVPLTVIERSRSDLVEGFAMTHPRTLRPSLNRLDAAYDRMQAELCARHRADGILTGKGGDVAFFQTATSAILADQIRDRGLSALLTSTAPVLARRMRRSAWRTLRAGLAAACSPRPYRPVRNPLLTADVMSWEVLPHPWLSDLDGLGPGKQQQIVGLASNLGLHGPSARTATTDLLHPALSQPVMEAVLATPIHVLTQGGHDRLLARQAFAGRLPEALLYRRSKGELGAYYGKVVAANIDRLRPHLLEGHLARQGVIDRDQVEAALSVDHLIWQGGYIELMMLGLMETWVRAWLD